MLRRALTVAAWAVGLGAVVLTVPLYVQTFVRYGWKVVPSMALPGSLALLLPALQVLFLVALLRELTGKAGAGTRQSYAAAAMAGEALELLFIIAQASSLQLTPGTPSYFVVYRPAQYWLVLIGLRILPSLCWITLLWMFWKKGNPLGSTRTRNLAGILCALEVVRGLRGAYRTASGLSRAVASLNWHIWDFVAAAISLLAWASLAFVLYAMYRGGDTQPGARLQS